MRFSARLDACRKPCGKPAKGGFPHSHTLGVCVLAENLKPWNPWAFSTGLREVLRRDAWNLPDLDQKVAR